MEDKRLATESVLLAEVPAAIELPEERPMNQKIAIAAVLVVIGLISLLVIAVIASSSATYSDMNSTLDEKRSNVMALVATTTAASAAVSALPGDTGTPIAEKLVDFSFYFMVILAVLYLEKFLLTTLGFLGFGILVPVACALFAGSVFARRGSMAKANLQSLGAKLAAFGVAIALVIPASVWLTDSIDNSFDESLAAANVAAQEATTQLEENAQDEGEGEGNILDNVFGTVQQGVEQLTQGAQEALDSLGRQLNTMIDTLAVMVVTSCLVPLLVLAVFLQLAKMVAGLDFGGVSGVMGTVRTRGRSAISSLKRPE